MDRYCVFGNPVAHSKSPAIHARFAELTGEAISYEARLAPKDGFAAALEAFMAEGGRGCNVTVPFKEEACRLAAFLCPRAEKAGAVNTLLLDENGRLCGDNTDGTGLVRDLVQNAGVVVAGRRLLLLGAGGAVRGVLGPLLAERPREIVIANRTPEKAVQLARLFADEGAVSASSFGALQGPFDIVINGTSASLQGELPPLPGGLFAADALAYDMMYGAAPTVFLRWAAAEGARTRDGLGMLVEQAAEAFRLWRGVTPPTRPVLEALRAGLGAH
jgi:shikimate dehydrogenase